MSNPFLALATLTDDSEDETIPQTPVRATEPVAPLAPKKRVKKRPVKVPLSEILSSPSARPSQQRKGKKNRVTYRRNAAGQLVAPSGAVAGRGPASSRRVSFKADDFPSFGGSVSGPVVSGTWTSGIDGVVAAKDLPDPAIARRQEAERRRVFLARQRAAAHAQGYVEYSDDEEYFSDEEELVEHDRSVARERLERAEVEEAAAMAAIAAEREAELDEDLSDWEAEDGQSSWSNGWSQHASTGSGWDDWD